MASQYRALSAEEIAELAGQGCNCRDWSKVEVAEGFDAGRVRSVQFSGSIRLGVFDRQFSFAGGVIKPAGISNATIYNCAIGNNVYINEVREHIANYVIEDDVIIENVDVVVVEGRSCFGNGTEVAVVNEGGGREILIYDHLSAHTAYIMAFYRHRGQVVERLQKMISQYSASVASSTGLLGKGARLINCRIIKNVKVGPGAVIEGVNRLENGSVNSCSADPVYIGPGVFAQDFIACSGSRITDGAMLSKCFVGQAAVLSRQFSAQDCVFFANSECFEGEAVAVFAGPFTVTHHKSTLLIASYFSFFNAGSGANQSNHMYRLGPVHQGVLERGCKAASNSYMLWPARFGAFSVVVGRHYHHADTSDFPFSYVNEQAGESILTPARYLRGIGLVRDTKKWPARDRRKGQENLDFVSFEPLSPYTMQRVVKALQLLEIHRATSDGKADYLLCPGVKIRSSAVRSGIELYRLVVEQFLGDCVAERLGKRQWGDIGELRRILSAEDETGSRDWVDLAGLLAPKELVEQALNDIEDGKVERLDQLEAVFRSIYESSEGYGWSWCVKVVQERLGKTIEEITADDIVIGVLSKWKSAVDKLARIHLANAENEYAAAVKIGYGPDGDEAVKDADFAAVRGSFEQDRFVCELREFVGKRNVVADELISRLEALR
jgi:hypothetical protein